MSDPVLPVDDRALDLYEEALKAGYTVDEDGTHHLVGADFSLPHLLDFFSGYDSTKSVLIGYDGGTPIYEHTEPIFSERDLIRALIVEVRRLRADQHV